jgi:hypothetical protein
MSEEIKKMMPQKDKKPFKSTWRDEYEETWSLTRKPVNINFLKKLACDWVLWAKDDPEALKTMMFFYNKGIAESTAYQWMKEHDFLEQSHKVVKKFIGARREIGAIKRIYDSPMIRTTMHHYDDIFKEDEEWRSKLRSALENETNGTKFIIMKDMPETDKVPPKKEKNDQSAG